MENNKRKERIKSVAIVFLTALLILTFFSNTIMNYSLPEVSAQYTKSGGVASKVRGTGVVEAVQPYQVKINENRKVEEVLVKTGDKVKKGQVLFRLGEAAAGSGNTLDETEDALDAARLEYRQKLYGEIPDDALQDLAVKNAKEDLDDAMEAQEEAKNKDKRLEKIRDSIWKVKDRIRDAEADINDWQEEIGAFDTADVDISFYEDEVEKVQNTITSWKNGLSDIEVQMTVSETELSKAQEDLTFWQKVEEGEEDPPDSTEGVDPYEKVQDLKKQIRDLQDKITELKTLQAQYNGNVNKANQALEKAQRALENAKKDAEKVNKERKDEMEEELRDMKRDLEKDKARLEELQEKETQVNQNTLTEEQAEENVKTAERALANAIIEYNKTRNQGNSQQQVSNLELEILQKKIGRLEKKAAELRSKSSEDPNEVKASVAGIISSVNFVAGEEATPDAPLAVIQIVEKGYRTSLTVTVEQSKRVKAGDKAEILNVWDSELEVVLTNIETDPANPNGSRILHFNVTGDTEIGQSLDLSVGERSANYDTIVPNSAVHEDSKGKFILIVAVKNSPLGNRYIATRVDVEVLASDDTNSAISGDLSGGDFVITTSTKPIDPGMQVRMIEGGAL